MSPALSPSSQTTNDDARRESASPVTLRSADLLQDRGCVLIEHQGMVYALRATRAGKLILTK
ncbi:MAG TPA: hemin uptake protein HemP [Zoogloea sp.]|uniref:hemin uptake protein HemP n=1 Tax=Zoogloea sp. TaxID=49181 RepID=UPI002C29976A|nr:hemin uptake protein HemP [Zoogloea sp.]HMV16402.1 hemin uptake protein HemP [Rhodocyclaceae bacterium]HMV61766.1 hemin uptake protein HemP [Rhodocyclaceae bacterium]HMW51142.1 hemin uptake protein HemP [Rhodocyclaceae bacterium]HMY48389.1 hemin uptake protein HemP [Rhodocyclaceae bacterium]HMZ75576.1 hemin uptake protein HemP [Rhodocyclaceae bacterium]